MKHTNPIADYLCRPALDKNGKPYSGAPAMLHNIKEMGGIDHVLDTVQESTIKATSAIIFSDTIASEKRAKIKKIS
ncbi:MAG: hypothetical protein K2H82_00260 [Oscillospiraceae bacterium]|nr:hypothetical protein [Oscillospiraceae bacterium]